MSVPSRNLNIKRTTAGIYSRKKKHQQQHKQMQLARVILIFVFIFINDSIISFGELQDSWNIKIVNKCPFLCKHFFSAVGVELVEHTGSH